MRSVTLIISGGIAAYKALELIRLLRKAHVHVYPVLTKGGAQFITPLSVAALAEEEVRDELFSLNDETKMGHIALSRASDLVVVAPASADIIAKMAHGMADDLATTILLASNRPVLIVPAMNPQMWQNAATLANIAALESRGVKRIGPAEGMAACGEEGLGRMVEPEEIFAAIQKQFSKTGPLMGRKAIVTAGPTHEPIDSVRFIANRSSGKQGYAFATALREAGCDVTLISGPTSLASPEGVACVSVATANEMLDAALAALPADIAVCAAAVADWRVKNASSAKIKRGGMPPSFELEGTPDILQNICDAGNRRPALVMGFAAETGNLEKNAREKILRKKCDALIANDVSMGVFGEDENEALCLWRHGNALQMEKLPRMEKTQLAKLVVQDMIKYLGLTPDVKAAS
jgi:phosphopantothenoylcysteine decarboxylase/phosphopantothenate--cysteine ligase